MKKISELKKYKWGLGIEHEMHMFHEPPDYSKTNIKDFTIFDSFSAVQRILSEKEDLKIDISYDDYNFLKSIPFETSGRKCNDKWVIEMVPVKMPEFITNFPFCSIGEKRDIKNMTAEIVENKERFYDLLKHNKKTRDLIKNYGDFAQYPYGMTRYLKCPISEKNGKYTFKKDKKRNDILMPEYNGSYHITMTLPHKESITDKQFIKMHQNFANQLQWLEPLMLTAYFTGDEYAPGEMTERVRGSFRVMIIGWGNFAGSDVRLFNKGIGRYAKTPTYWRKNLRFKDSNKLKPCYKPSPMAKKEKAITSLSSNFRTFGSTDPLRPMHRESGVGMTKPNGIEFRIFDHFNDKYIEHLMMFVSLVAENSRVTKTNGYVYKDKTWIKELHNIMKHGYKAKISDKYKNILRKKLGLKIKTDSIIAIDIFKTIYEELWKKNINGDWSKIFHCMKAPKFDMVLFPNVNKKAWQFAFMMKLNRNKKLMDKFNKMTKIISALKTVKYNDLKKIILKIYGKRWAEDIEDIIYFYEELELISLNKNKDHTIDSINVLLKRNNKPIYYKNFNDFIATHFSEGGRLSNIL